MGRSNVIPIGNGFRHRWLGLVRTSGVSRTARVVAEELWWYMRNKDHCWPKIATLAKGIGASPSTVRRALRELVNAKLLAIEHRHGRPPKSAPDQGSIYRAVEPPPFLPAEEAAAEPATALDLAWHEVRRAAKAGDPHPIFTDPRTAAAVASIGAWASVLAAATARRLPGLADPFAEAFGRAEQPIAADS